MNCRDSDATAPAEFPPEQPEADLNDDGVIYGAEESELEAALQRELKSAHQSRPHDHGNEDGQRGEDQDMGDNDNDNDNEDDDDDDDAGSVDLEQSSDDEDDDDEEDNDNDNYGDNDGDGEGDIEMDDDEPAKGQHTAVQNTHASHTVAH